MEENIRSARKTYSRVGLYFLIATVSVQVFSVVIGYALRKLVPGLTIDANGEILYSVILIYGFGFPATLFLMKKTLPAQKPEKTKVGVGQYLIWLIMVLGVAYTSNIVGVVISSMLEQVTHNPVENMVGELASDASPVLVLAYMVIIAPILEELFFRKLIVDRTMKYGKGAAIVMSGLMFGLFHGNLLQFMYACTIGMLFAYIYTKSGKIQITISLHMIFNFLGGFVATRLVDAVDLDKLQSVYETGSQTVIMSYLSEHVIGVVGLLLFGFIVIMSIFAGDILVIIFACLGKFSLPAGEDDVPKGKRLSTLFLNAGMLAYIAVWVVLIVIELI